jgi:hypothetical protein
MSHAATILSPVVDEQSHISRGLSVLRTGDLRLRIGHPIGLNVWQALPLALDPSVRLPLDHESWRNAAWDRFGEQFLWRINANPDGIVFRSRLMIALLTLVLGALVFRWAHDLRGPRAAVLALALYALDPNILAHGLLATTDLGVALFMFAAMYALWRATRSNERRWFVAAGVLTGLAMLAKYSALILIPSLAVLLLWTAREAQSMRSILQPAAFICFPALLVVLAVYLLRFDLYLGELSFLLANTETHPSFLLGQRSVEGWWYYFFVTFLLKTPLPTLVLIGAASVLTVRQRAWRGETFLLVPAVSYLLFSVVSGFNVGYRHLLPALPFLMVYASKIIQTRHPAFVTRHGVRFTLYPPAWLTGASIVWLAASSIAAHPDYIAYFNEAAPSPRYNVLVDSNLDWGQSLKQLRAYLDAQAIDRVKLSYFGTADPAAYGIRYDPLPRWPPKQTDFVPANPAPGVYAISASNLQGILLDDPGAFDWFRRRSPDAIVGGSILVYHVAADIDPPQAVGLCREPWTPIADEEVDALFGRRGLRVVRFDCVNSWWWPDGPAWYVVPPGVAPDTTEQLEYERRRRDDSLVFRVIRRARPAILDALDLPAQFDGGLTLLGFNWSSDWQAGGSIEVESAWRVDALLTPPVSIFAHLLDPNGSFVVDADGLGVPPELLQPGDIFRQQHRFELAPGAPGGEHSVEFGFYRLDTLERYTAIVDGKPIDRVLAQPGDSNR